MIEVAREDVERGILNKKMDCEKTIRMVKKIIRDLKKPNSELVKKLMEYRELRRKERILCYVRNRIQDQLFEVGKHIDKKLKKKRNLTGWEKVMVEKYVLEKIRKNTDMVKINRELDDVRDKIRKIEDEINHKYLTLTEVSIVNALLDEELVDIEDIIDVLKLIIKKLQLTIHRIDKNKEIYVKNKLQPKVKKTPFIVKDVDKMIKKAIKLVKGKQG